MIDNLEIINGSINQMFNKDKFEYVVSVDSSVSTLIFSYDLVEDAEVTIYGNDELTDGENHVYLEVYSNDKVTTYTFVVNKETVNEVFNYEVSMQKEFKYKTPIIFGSCFILIVVLFCIIFKKKNKIYYE